MLNCKKNGKYCYFYQMLQYNVQKYCFRIIIFYIIMASACSNEDDLWYDLWDTYYFNNVTSVHVCSVSGRESGNGQVQPSRPSGDICGPVTKVSVD